MAQEVKRRVDLKAAAITTEEDLQLRPCAVHYVLSRCNMLNGPLLKVQKVPLIIQMEKVYIHKTTIDEFKDMKRGAIAEKEEQKKKKKKKKQL